MSRLTDIIATSAAPVTWGTTYVVTTQLLPPDRPLLAATVRALPTGLVIMAGYRRLPPPGVRIKVATLSFFNIGIFFVLLFVAAFELPGGVAAIVISLTPLIVVVLSWPLLGTRPSIATSAIAIAGTAGVALVALQGKGTYDPAGLFAGLGAALAVAIGVVLQKRWGIGAPATLMAGWQLAAAGLVLLPVTVGVEGLPSTVTGANVAGALYLTLIGTGLAYVLWFRGIQRLGPQLVTFLSLLSPVVAVAAGILILQQTLDLRQAAGIALVVTAVVLASSRRQTPAPSQVDAS